MAIKSSTNWAQQLTIDTALTQSPSSNSLHLLHGNSQSVAPSPRSPDVVFWFPWHQADMVQTHMHAKHPYTYVQKLNFVKLKKKLHRLHNQVLYTFLILKKAKRKPPHHTNSKD